MLYDIPTQFVRHKTHQERQENMEKASKNTRHPFLFATHFIYPSPVRFYLKVVL